MLPPPKHVAPARLFRLLTQRPRPAIEIPFRFAAAPGVALVVRALTALEYGEAADAAGVGPPDVQAGRFTAELVARALFTSEARVFTAGRQVADSLPAPELEAVARDVLRALDVISPSYARADVRAWNLALVSGARAAGNLHAAYALGRCFDIVVGHRHAEVISRPERYFGGCQADLTDGHWMAFRAARAVAAEVEKRNG